MYVSEHKHYEFQFFKSFLYEFKFSFLQSFQYQYSFSI